jgi:RimJ/RimL family protein N-acetyltransferase
VTAEVHESNLASRRLLERLGFTIDRLASPYVWYARASG